MESHFPKAFDSKVLSCKTLTSVIWVPFRLHWKWKRSFEWLILPSVISLSLFNPLSRGLLYILISWTVHLMEPFFFDLLSWFPGNYPTVLLFKTLCPFLLCLFCYYALPPNCVSVPWLSFGLSFLTLYHLSHLSQFYPLPEFSSSNIQRPFRQLN